MSPSHFIENMAADKRKETPQERWSKKNGYSTKGFKMYKKQADAFAAACEKAGKPQSVVIVELMEKFIKENQ